MLLKYKIRHFVVGRAPNSMHSRVNHVSRLYDCTIAMAPYLLYLEHIMNARALMTCFVLMRYRTTIDVPALSALLFSIFVEH